MESSGQFLQRPICYRTIGRKPTAPVKIHIQQLDSPPYDSGFSKFNFEEGLWDE